MAEIESAIARISLECFSC